MSDIFLLLHQDHQALFNLIETLSFTRPGRERNRVTDQLAKEIEVHCSAEEETLYPHLQEIEATEDIASRAFDEHFEIRESLGLLQSVRGDDPEWRIAVADLRESLAHHVDEEESEMFDKMRDVFDNDMLTQIREDFIEMKKQLREDQAA